MISAGSAAPARAAVAAAVLLEDVLVLRPLLGREDLLGAGHLGVEAGAHLVLRRVGLFLVVFLHLVVARAVGRRHQGENGLVALAAKLVAPLVELVRPGRLGPDLAQ